MANVGPKRFVNKRLERSFDGKLYYENRWAKMTKRINWDEIVYQNNRYLNSVKQKVANKINLP